MLRLKLTNKRMPYTIRLIFTSLITWIKWSIRWQLTCATHYITLPCVLYYARCTARHNCFYKDSNADVFFLPTHKENLRNRFCNLFVFSMLAQKYTFAFQCLNQKAKICSTIQTKKDLKIIFVLNKIVKYLHPATTARWNLLCGPAQ